MNSSYDMLERYLEQQPAIFAARMSKDVKTNLKDVVTLSYNDVTQAEELIQILKPLKTTTTIMCDEHTNTVSMISPLKEIMVRALTNLDTDSELIKQVKETIKKTLNLDTQMRR